MNRFPLAGQEHPQVLNLVVHNLNIAQCVTILPLKNTMNLHVPYESITSEVKPNDKPNRGNATSEEKTKKMILEKTSKKAVNATANMIIINT